MHRIRDIDKIMAASLASPAVSVHRVGGSVRDEIIGRKPKDADYIVQGMNLTDLTLAAGRLGKATPLKLRDGRIVGSRVHIPGHGLVEIALPRTEVSTGPGHRDFEIVVDPALSLGADAERRDFSINALYRDVVDGSLVDGTGRGLHDIEHKLINTTHHTSFRDDPLRALRALRFVSQLDFDLSKPAASQMHEHHEAVTGLTDKGVSGTALDELCKLLMGKRPDRALRYGRDYGVLAVLLPELAPIFDFDQQSKYHDMTTDEHTFEALRVAAAMNLTLRVRLALLFHDAGKPEACWVGEDGRKHYYKPHPDHPVCGPFPEIFEDHEEISARLAREALLRLNTPKRLRDDVVMLVRRHMVSVSGNTKATKVRRWRVELGDELLADLFKHRLADCMGKGSINYDHVQAIARLEKIREDAERLKVPTTPRELEIRGGDIAALGARGREIGDVQRKLLDEVVCQPDRNDRDWLLERAWKLAGSKQPRSPLDR